MAHNFWLECANFALEGDQSARSAVEAVEQDLKSFKQPTVERVGQTFTEEWAILAHLIGSLAICSVNNQAEYWAHTWHLLITGQDGVRISWLDNPVYALESVCMSPESVTELLDGLPADQRHLVVHCLLAASVLLAQACCAMPATQPFTVFTTWVEYARMMEALPSPVDLNIPQASALHLLLHWLKSTSPFPKFLQNHIIPATAAAVSNAQMRILQSKNDDAGAHGVSDPTQPGETCATAAVTNHHDVNPAHRSGEDHRTRGGQKASKSPLYAGKLTAQHQGWCSCLVAMWRNVLDCLLSVQKAIQRCLDIRPKDSPTVMLRRRIQHFNTPCFADPGDAVGSTLCSWFADVLGSNAALFVSQSTGSLGSDEVKTPLPHASMSSLIRLQCEALTAAASYVSAICQEDMPPTVVTVRRVLPLCGLAMPKQAQPQAARSCGLLLLADVAASEKPASAQISTPVSISKCMNSTWMACPSPAASMISGTPAQTITTGSYRAGDEPASSLAGSCFSAEAPRFQCQSTAETEPARTGSHEKWECPVLQAVAEAVLASVDRCEVLQYELEDFKESESGLVQYTAEALRAQRLLCAALSAAPKALLPANKLVQARLVDAIAKLFVANIPEPSEEQHGALPGLAAFLNSRSPEIQAHAMHPGWNSSTPPNHSAGVDKAVGLVACSRLVRHALRHNFATLMATVLHSMALAADENTTVHTVASETVQADLPPGLSNAAAAGGVTQGRRAAGAQRHQGNNVSVSMTLACAVTTGLQIAVEKLCSSVSLVPTATLPSPDSQNDQAHKVNAQARAAAQRFPMAESESSRAGALRDVSAANLVRQSVPNFMPACPPVHTPGAGHRVGKDHTTATSPRHRNIIDRPCPSMTPTASATPGAQAANQSAFSLSRAFMFLNHALIDCVENVFDAAQTRWAEEDPGIMAATPMNTRQRTYAHLQHMAVPKEVESVLALCGSLAEVHEEVSSNLLRERESAWMTSLYVDSGPSSIRSAEHTYMSPLLQLHSPMSPFVCYGPASGACRSTVTLVHVIPVDALCSALDAAMKLPVDVLQGVNPAVHVRMTVNSRAQLHTVCCSMTRAAQRTLLASDADANPSAALQSIAAAKSAMYCASVAMEACKASASPAPLQATLTTLQVVPQAIHTLFDTSWKCPDVQAQLSIHSTMLELLQSVSQCDKYNILAQTAFSLLTDAEKAGSAPPDQWLHFAMLAISALTACSVASVTVMRQQQGDSRTDTVSEPKTQPVKDRISGGEVFVVITATLHHVMSALKLPGVAGRARAKQNSIAEHSNGSVTMQQWRSWLTVLLQLCLEAAACALEDCAADVAENDASALIELNSALQQVANYLTSAKQRENVSGLLWFAMFPDKPSTTLRAVGKAAATHPIAGTAVVVLMRALAARKVDCPNGKRAVTWERVHEVVHSTQLSTLWPLPTADTLPAVGNAAAIASRRAPAATPSVSRKRKICASEVLDEGPSTASGVAATTPASSSKAPRPMRLTHEAQSSRPSRAPTGETPAACPARNAGVNAAAGNMRDTPCGQAGRSTDPGTTTNAVTRRVKMRSGAKWLLACTHLVGAAVAHQRSHAISTSHHRDDLGTTRVSWQMGLDDVHRMLESAKGSAESSASLMRLSSTLIRIQAAQTGASQTASVGPSKGGAVVPSVDADCTQPTGVLQSEQPGSVSGASEDAHPGMQAPKQAETPSASGKPAAVRPTGSMDDAHLQPAATVSALATCTSIDVMCDADGTPTGSGHDPGSAQPTLPPTTSSKPEGHAESVLLHIGLVLAPAVTPMAAAAASCVHLLAFSRRYAGIGYPAVPGYMPAWVESACMQALPKCMHDSIRTGKSLVRTRLSAASDSPSPDIRPLWVLSELLRRCSEATGNIVEHKLSEGIHTTELEAPFTPNSSVKPNARCSSQAQDQKQQNIEELLLCLVCLAATQAGLAIRDAQAEYGVIAVSTSNGNATTSGAARHTTTCLSAAAAGSHVTVDTHTADGTGDGGIGAARDTAAEATRAQLVREVLFLSQSHLEHIVYALANGVKLAATQLFSMIDKHEKEGMMSAPGAATPSSGARLLCELRNMNTGTADPHVHAPPTLPRNQVSARSGGRDSSHLNCKPAASTSQSEPETPRSPRSQRYRLRSNSGTTPQLPDERNHTPRLPPVPLFHDSPVRSATAAEDAGAHMYSNSKPKTPASRRTLDTSAPAASASRQRTMDLSAVLAGHFERLEKQNAEVEAEMIPAVPHASAVAAARLITTFCRAQRVISRLVNLLNPDEQRSNENAQVPLRPSEGAPPPQRARDGAFGAQCTPTAAANSPCDTVPVIPSHTGSGTGHRTFTPHLHSNTAPRDTPGSKANATASVLFASAIRTPGSHPAELATPTALPDNKLQACVLETQKLEAALVLRLEKLAKHQGTTATLNRMSDHSPATVDAAQRRRGTIAASLLQTIDSTEGDVLGFLAAPEASAVVSEASDAVEEDTACGASPADEVSDRDPANPAEENAFVEPDDPRELEKDVAWMNTRREQTENDPAARETLLQLLELAGGGATAIKGVDAQLADAIKEFVEASEDDVDDGESLSSQDTEEASDEEDNDHADQADEDARKNLEDDLDSEDDGDDSGSSSGDGDSSGSGDSSEQDDESNSGEIDQEQANPSDAAKRRNARRAKAGEDEVGGHQGACSEAPARSKAGGKSMAKSGQARSKQGVAGSSATVDRAKSREVASDSHLPRRMQSVTRSFISRPKGSHATKGFSEKGQSKSSSKKSRSARAEKIGNSWLSAAVAVGEGSVDDALALADFVVAQPERDYDSLLRSRYWSHNSRSDRDVE